MKHSAHILLWSVNSYYLARIGALCGIPIDLMGDGVVANLKAAVLLVHGFDFRHLGGRRGFEIAVDVCVKGWPGCP
jgi:hypothetical protein